jgi:transposase
VVKTAKAIYAMRASCRRKGLCRLFRQEARLVDAATGEMRDVELFVMVLGASNYTYAEATYTQTLRDFVDSNIHGFEFFGGVPEVVVPRSTSQCR